MYFSMPGREMLWLNAVSLMPLNTESPAMFCCEASLCVSWTESNRPYIIACIGITGGRENVTGVLET